jgi:RNA-directed DNA polymerase
VTADQRWVVLYVKRWLAAPLWLPDGTLAERDRGIPQGSVISPVLANLFMHFAFDLWLAREFPAVEFERYADDAVVHCVTERQAREVLAVLVERMGSVGLWLHPDKTKIVYCKDDGRRGSYERTSFTFLGYTFRPRSVQSKDGRKRVSFSPAVSPEALNAIGRVVRRWPMHLWMNTGLDEIARQINPIVAGWMNYYGRFYRSQLNPLLSRINTRLMRWAGQKYKRLRSYKRFKRWWLGIIDRDPELFAGEHRRHRGFGVVVVQFGDPFLDFHVAVEDPDQRPPGPPRQQMSVHMGLVLRERCRLQPWTDGVQ